MKKLLLCLILASAAQMLPMEPEETEFARYLNNLPLHEMLIALEEHEARFEVSMKNHEEKLAQIERHTWYGDTGPTWYGDNGPIELILNLLQNRTKKECKQGIDELCLSIELANAYEGKVQSYLANKEDKHESHLANELRLINQRVHLLPIVEKLLLSDNPKRIDAIKTIILNAPKLCYDSPIDVVYIHTLYPSLRQTKPDKFVKFLKEATKPSSIECTSKFEQKRKLGNIGYLINKFDVPGNVKDQIFSHVLANFLRENQTEVQSSLFKLSISDLAKFRSNIPSLELPRLLYEEGLNKASKDLGYVMKRLGATYDHENERHDFETLTAKRAVFDEYIRPIITEHLPGYNLDAPDNNEPDN